MSHLSKYYNLDKPGPGWTKTDFAYVVRTLENVPREELLAMLSRSDIAIQFAGADWRQTTPHEQLVSVLITDVPAAKLLAIVRETTRATQVG
jgi:hypothetical protein